MVFIPRKMSDELIARFRVGCPILLQYEVFDNGYTIIELSTTDQYFPIDTVRFIQNEDVQVTKSNLAFLGETIFLVEDQFGIHSRISWKISLETFEKVCQHLEKN